MRREKNSEAPNRVESGLKDRIRMLVCTDNAVSKGVKVNMLSSNLRLDCVESHRPKRARAQKDRSASASL